jgi:hypothetical protein
MRKTRFTFREFCFAILFFMSLFSCKKNDLQKGSNNPTALYTAKLSIFRLGLDTSKVVDMGDFYLVGNDIGIKKTSLNSTIQRQVYFNQHPFVTASRQNNLTVRISEDVPSDGSNLDWHTAISMAIAQWNSLSSSNIRFTLVNTPTADMTIHTQAINDANLCAFIDDWPTGGLPSQYITINTLYHYHNSSYTDEQKKWVMVHELGHAVNIAHTNEYYYWYATKIGASPDVDENSVFNCCMAGLTFSGFSYWDEYAIGYLYPLVVDVHYNNQSGTFWKVTATNTATNIVYNRTLGTYHNGVFNTLPEGNYTFHFSNDGLSVFYNTTFTVNGKVESVVANVSDNSPRTVSFNNVSVSSTSNNPLIVVNEYVTP